MGSITGAAGGVIRDVFINEIPLIFRKEIYAMACVVGGTAYWICELAGMHSYGCQVIGGMSVFITRILAVKYKICLPILSGNDGGGRGERKLTFRCLFRCLCLPVMTVCFHYRQTFLVTPTCALSLHRACFYLSYGNITII